ncbi:MAG: ABC transporter permease [Candidatus Methanomethylophilaceae archaeon]
MTNTLPSDFAQMLTVTRYEMYKFLRGKKIYVMVGLMALLIILTTAIPPLMGVDLPSDSKAFMSNYVSWVSTLIIIAVTLFSAGALVSEFEERTGFLLFPRPVKRSTLFAGKYMASFLVCAALTALYYLVSSLLSLYFTGSVYFETLYSLGLAMLFIIGTSGFAFLLSSVMQKGSTAAILVFATLFLIMPMLEGIMMFVNSDPFFLLSHAGISIGNVIDGLTTTTIPIGEGMSVTTYYPRTDVAAAVMSVWGVVCSALALMFFYRREL